MMMIYELAALYIINISIHLTIKHISILYRTGHGRNGKISKYVFFFCRTGHGRNACGLQSFLSPIVLMSME